MKNTNDKLCEATSQLIFSCSGAADVGNIADLTARQLTKEGLGKMFCIVGIGGQAEPILTATQKASSLLAIDGCPLDCAKKTLEKAGFCNVTHIRVTDLGMDKGKTLISGENISVVRNKAQSVLER
jgi:uncharacterized metal-binding protein